MTGETRLLRAVRAIVARLVEPTAYYALVRYRVVATVANPGGGLFYQLQAVKATAGWPDSINVVSQCGAPGIDGQPQQGSTVLVSFIEGDPSMPIITHFERPDAPGWQPVGVTLDAQDVATTADNTGCPVCYGDDFTITIPTGEVVGLVGYSSTPITAPAGATITGTVSTTSKCPNVKVRRP